MKGPDPRKETVSASEVPVKLREGGDLFDARSFWHAHEAWETAWHALRAQGDVDGAAFVRGLILVAAACENATRGKEAGFKRQGAEGLHALRGATAAGARLGLRDAPRWVDEATAFYLDACRQTDWPAWNASGWTLPPLRME